MRYPLLLCLLLSLPSVAQTDRYKLTQKDTLITCTLNMRSTLAGPFSDTHSADFENLAKAVFKASPFPEYPYSIYRTKDPNPLRIGCHTYDELEYHTFLLYNLDSAMEFNLKAKTRYGLMSLLAHEVGHHAFHHFLRGPNKNIATQELQADYFAGWLLAKLAVPQEEITKGLSVVTNDEAKNELYPSVKDRINATLLGYTLGSTAGAGPLALIENGNQPSEEWLTKWSRAITQAEETVDLTETSFSGIALELDRQGQLIYTAKDKRYSIARAMPSKDPRYAYLLFDNQFNYWWVGKDGTVKDAKEERVLATVNLNVLADQ